MTPKAPAPPVLVTYNPHQNGAVLLVVLIFLVLIVSVGVVAVRSSSTDLKVATSDQVDTVLLQAADSANNKLQQAVNSDPSSSQYQAIMGITGIMGYYALAQDERRGDVMEFCYRPRSDFFNITKASIKRGGGYLVDNTQGFCDATNANDYVSGRGTTMVQMQVQPATSAAATEPFENYKLGGGVSSNETTKQVLDVYSTAVLPAYGSADSSKVQDCFKKDASSSSDSVSTCMTDNGIPSKLLVSQVDLTNTQATEVQKDFGK